MAYSIGSTWFFDEFTPCNNGLLPEVGAVVAVSWCGSKWTIAEVVSVGDEFDPPTIGYYVTDPDGDSRSFYFGSYWAPLEKSSADEPTAPQPTLHFDSAVEAAIALLEHGLVEYVKVGSYTGGYTIGMNDPWTAEEAEYVQNLIATHDLRQSALSKLTPAERTALGL
jgi:hypothetical protein